jgi:hypothetical protein
MENAKIPGQFAVPEFFLQKKGRRKSAAKKRGKKIRKKAAFSS